MKKKNNNNCRDFKTLTMKMKKNQNENLQKLTAQIFADEKKKIVTKV